MTTVAGIGEEFRPDARRKVGLPPDVVKRLTKLNPIKSTLGVFETLGLIVISLAVALYWWTPWAIIPAMVVIVVIVRRNEDRHAALARHADIRGQREGEAAERLLAGEGV